MHSEKQRILAYIEEEETVLLPPLSFTCKHMSPQTHTQEKRDHIAQWNETYFLPANTQILYYFLCLNGKVNGKRYHWSDTHSIADEPLRPVIRDTSYQKYGVEGGWERKNKERKITQILVFSFFLLTIISFYLNVSRQEAWFTVHESQLSR